MDPLSIAAALGAALTAGILTTLSDAGKTSQKITQAWTLEAAFNVVCCHQWHERAAQAIGARRTSTYRCEAVNKAVGGSPTSDHLKGTATDLVPQKMTPREGFLVLAKMTKNGELGPVKQLILESHKNVVHISHYPIGTPPKPPQFLEQTDPKTFKRVEV